MPANPERMRPTDLSNTFVMKEANAIVKAEAELVTREPNTGQAKYARQFLYEVFRVEDVK